MLSKKEAITQKIENFFHPTVLEVSDNSTKHKGHREVGKNNRETHFEIVIVSDLFSPMSLIERHRSVYKLLKEEFSKKGGVHALKIRAYTPREYALFQTTPHNSSSKN